MDAATGDFDELIEFRTLLDEDRELLGGKRGATALGFALLLKHYSRVNLTTFGQDARTMANLAVTRAVGRLTGQQITEREMIIPPSLVVRGTTAPPAEQRRATNEAP